MNNERRIRKLKRDKEISRRKHEEKKPSEIIDNVYLQDRLGKILHKKDITLLYVGVLVSRINGAKIEAVIYNNKESVSHDNCSDATIEIKKIINDKGLHEEDYSITVSSPGFRWKFAGEKEFEIFKNAPIKITYKKDAAKIIGAKTVSGILIENRDNEIEIENEKENINISKKAIERINLNY